jgi:hypothetical protein
VMATSRLNPTLSLRSLTKRIITWPVAGST